MSIGDPQMRCSTQYHLSRLKCSSPPFSIRVVLLTQLCCDVAQKEAGLSALCKLTRETTGFLPRTLPLSYFLLRVCLLSSLPPAYGIHRSTSNSLAAFHIPLSVVSISLYRDSFFPSIFSFHFCLCSSCYNRFGTPYLRANKHTVQLLISRHLSGLKLKIIPLNAYCSQKKKRKCFHTQYIN